MNDQGSNPISTIEQLGCIALCNMKTFKEEINHCLHEPLLDCISHWRLGFEALKETNALKGIIGESSSKVKIIINFLNQMLKGEEFKLNLNTSQMV